MFEIVLNGYFIISASMDVTVDLLVEVDKLIQLLESPIFICKYKNKKNENLINIARVYYWCFCRLKNGTSGGTSESVFDSSTLRTPNDNAAIGCISFIETQVKMCSSFKIRIREVCNVYLIFFLLTNERLFKLCST